MATPRDARGRRDEVFLAPERLGGRQRRIRIGRNVLTAQDLVRYSPRAKNDELWFVCQDRLSRWCAHFWSCLRTKCGDEVGEAMVSFERVAQVPVGINAVAVASPDFVAGDVAAVDEIAEDQLNCARCDADTTGDLWQCLVRVGR